MNPQATNAQGETVEYINGQWVPQPSPQPSPQSSQAPQAVDDRGNVIEFTNGQWTPVNAAQGQRGILSSGFGSQVGGTADMIAQGLTFGFSDEIEAGLQSLWPQEGTTYSDRYDRNVNEARDRMDQYRLENPKTAFASEAVGGLTTGVGAALKFPYMVAKSIPKAIGVGMAEGGLMGAGKSDGESLLTDTTVGAGIGALAGPLAYGAGELVGRGSRLLPEAIDAIKNNRWTGGSRVVQDLPQLDSFRYQPEGAMAQRNVANARALGYELSPAEISGNPNLEQLESNLRRNVGGAGPFVRRQQRNQQRVQQLANQRLGISGEEVDLGRARQVNNQQFTDAARTGERVDLDEPFEAAVQDIQQDYSKAWGRGDKKAIFKDIEKEIESGPITMRRYQDLMSRLSDDLNRAAKKGDGGLVRLYGGLQDALDEAAERSVPASNKLFHDAREAYKVRKVLERRGVVNPATGEISIPKMANAMKRDNSYIYGHDQSHLATAARVNHAFKSNIGSSGTPEGAAGGIVRTPLFWAGSKAYNAMPHQLLGSSGWGQYGKRASLLPYSPLLDEYRQ